MNKFDKLVGKKGKKITKRTPTISKNGKMRTKHTFRILPTILEEFEKEVLRKKLDGEKITMAEAIEEAIELWLEKQQRSER